MDKRYEALDVMTFPSMEQVQKAHVRNAFERFDGNVTDIACALEVTVKTVYNWLSKDPVLRELYRDIKERRSGHGQPGQP